MNKVILWVSVMVATALMVVVIACQRVTVVDGTLNDQEESGVVYRSKPRQTDKGHQERLQKEADDSAIKGGKK